jgi:F-type H+-transporting ATPase subunit epsilon
MPEYFSLEVHTPYRLFFSGHVEVITLTLSDGDIGVYAHHAPFTAPVVSCVLRMKSDKGEWRHAFVADGILEVKDHKTVLMADAAEWPEEIDRERALAAKTSAEEYLKGNLLKFEKENATAKLRRAQNRIKVVDIK